MSPRKLSPGTVNAQRTPARRRASAIILPTVTGPLGTAAGASCAASAPPASVVGTSSIGSGPFWLRRRLRLGLRPGLNVGRRHSGGRPRLGLEIRVSVRHLGRQDGVPVGELDVLVRRCRNRIELSHGCSAGR